MFFSALTLREKNPSPCDRRYLSNEYDGKQLTAVLFIGGSWWTLGPWGVLTEGHIQELDTYMTGGKNGTVGGNGGYSGGDVVVFALSGY